MNPIWGHTSEGCIFPAHSQREWELILGAHCAFRCFYCARPLVAHSATKDHLVPISRGGCDCRGNLVAACSQCNSMKKERTVYEFLRVRPAFVNFTGKFYTSITALKPLTDPRHDPLMKEIVRISTTKRFPAIDPYFVPKEIEHYPASAAWRTK